MKPAGPGARLGRRARFGLGLLGVLGLGLWPRLEPVLEWRTAPERHFAGGAAVAGADSYYFVRLARELGEGHTGPYRDPLRRHPGGMRYESLPLLSHAIAATAALLRTDAYRAGMLLGLGLACLFAIPLGVYFRGIGLPAAGLAGGLVGALAPAYLTRSWAYRIDTDGANHFFAWLVPLGFLALARARGLAGQAAAAVATGLVLWGFTVWYERPPFAWAYLVCLGPFLWLRGLGAPRTLGLWALAALAANPLAWRGGWDKLWYFVRAHLLSAPEAAPDQVVVYPPMLANASEARGVDPAAALAALLDPPALAALGLLGFAAFAWRRPLWTLPLLPPFALGVMGLVRSQRLLMYLAPFVGIGWGYALSRLPELASRRLPPAAAARVARLAPLGLAAALLAALPFTGFDREPRPRVTPALLASVAALGERLPAGAVVAHGWGHGYLINDVAGAATFNDGGGPDPRVEHLLSVGFAAASPETLGSVLSFLAARGAAGIEDALARGGTPALLRALAEAPTPHAPVAVLFSGEMSREFHNSVRLATWDFEAGRGHRAGYDVRHCTPEPAAETLLRCRRDARPDLLVDSEAGSVDGRPIVRRLLRVHRGRVVAERSWPVKGVVLQLLDDHGEPPWRLHVLEPLVYRSNFNQMFHLGRHDERLFRPILDDYPTARAWELLASPDPAKSSRGGRGEGGGCGEIKRSAVARRCGPETPQERSLRTRLPDRAREPFAAASPFPPPVRRGAIPDQG